MGNNPLHVLFRASHVDIQVHLYMLPSAQPSPGDIGMKTYLVVARLVRGECEPAVGGSTGVDDAMARRELLGQASASQSLGRASRSTALRCRRTCTSTCIPMPSFCAHSFFSSFHDSAR